MATLSEINKLKSDDIIFYEDYGVCGLAIVGTYFYDQDNYLENIEFTDLWTHDGINYTCWVLDLDNIKDFRILKIYRNYTVHANEYIIMEIKELFPEFFI
jgi:hypothetical protein